jgi:hypothetical protein
VKALWQWQGGIFWNAIILSEWLLLAFHQERLGINSWAGTDDTSSQADKTTTPLSKIEGRQVHSFAESMSFGGMLRALLCGWDWVQDVLVRETVIRMQSDVVEVA